MSLPVIAGTFFQVGELFSISNIILDETQIICFLYPAWPRLSNTEATGCSHNFQGIDLQRTKVFAPDSCFPQNRIGVVFVGTSRVVSWPSYSIPFGASWRSFTWIIICGHRSGCPRLTEFLFWCWRTDEFKYTVLVEYQVMESQILRTLSTSALVSKGRLRDKQMSSLMLLLMGSFTLQGTFPVSASATNVQWDLN